VSDASIAFRRWKGNELYLIVATLGDTAGKMATPSR
jgi:hypothetical protein